MKRIPWLWVLGAFGLALIAFGATAHAADLSARPQFKALPLTGGYPTRCGFFFGLNTQGAAGKVVGDVDPGTVTLQGDLGALIGYTCPLAQDGSMGWFIEGDFNWTNINGRESGFALSGPAHFEQRFAVWGGIDKILSVFPSLGFPAFPSTPLLPAGVTAGPSQLYMFGSTHEQDISVQFGLATNREWAFSPGLGIGHLTRWSNGIVVDTFAEWQFRSNEICVGPTKCAGTGNVARVGVGVKY